MAKVTSLTMKGTQGTLQGLTFVKSKRYGAHVRSKRGTIKPAVINDAFVASKERLVMANQQAKLIFNAVRNEHKDGTLWSRLLSVFRNELKEGKKPGVDCLKDLECSKEFRLDRLISLSIRDFSVEIGKKKMKIAVNLKDQPVWKRSRSINGYQLGVVLVFLNFAKGMMHKEGAFGKVLGLDDKPGSVALEVAIPKGYTEYLLFIKLNGCFYREIETAPFAKGMRVIAAGKMPVPSTGRKLAKAGKRIPSKKGPGQK